MDAWLSMTLSPWNYNAHFYIAWQWRIHFGVKAFFLVIQIEKRSNLQQISVLKTIRIFSMHTYHDKELTVSVSWWNIPIQITSLTYINEQYSYILYELKKLKYIFLLQVKLKALMLTGEFIMLPVHEFKQ